MKKAWLITVLDFNPSMQQLGQNVLPVFDSLVFF